MLACLVWDKNLVLPYLLMRVFGLMPWLLLTENSLPSARSFPHFWHPFRLPHFLWNTSYLILYFLTVVQAARTFLSSSGGSLDRKGVDIDDNHASFVQHYLNKAISLLSCDILDGERALSLVPLAGMHLFLVSDVLFKKDRLSAYVM